MQNNRNNQQPATESSLLIADGSRNDLPPTKSFGEIILDGLFPNDEFSDDILAPFDYEGFLRKEGLSW